MSIERSGAMALERSARAVEKKAFMGWRIVAAAFLAQFFANAVTFSAFSNFTLPLSESFSVPRNRITLGMTIAIGCLGLLSPLVGRWMDHGHARRIMMGGSILSGTGLLWMSQIEDLRLFTFVFGAFVCVGAALFGVMPSMTLVANWFIKRRGFALGVTFAGATIVSAIAPISAQFFIDHYGWRTALQIFGIAVLAIGVPCFGFFVVGRPEEVGQLPDGEPLLLDLVIDDAASMGRPLTVQELARDPRLWLISLGFGLLMTSPLVLLSVIIPFGQDLGFSAQQSNLFLAAAVPFSLIGKLGLGALVDRAPAKPIIALIVVMNLLVWVILYSQPGFGLFVLCGTVYGLGIGGAAPVQGVVIGRCFGRVNFGTASGLGGILAILLLIMATLMSSLLQGEQGEGYPTVFIVQFVLLLLGGLVLAAIRIPGVEDSMDHVAT